MSRPRAGVGETTTLDHLMDGKLLIQQPLVGHRGGTDTMLLSAAAPSTSGMLLDLGAGVGTAGLAVALRGGCARLTLAEIQPELAGLAAENIALNNLADRARAICADALTAAGRRKGGLENGMADIVIANPPYLTRGRSQTSPDSSRAIAHSLGESGIESWCRAAAALLPPDGRFVMIHRADFLAEILPVFGGRFGAVEIIPVYPREGERAHRIIMRGIKGSRAPLAILPPVFLHKADGSFTPRAAALHRGDEVIA